MLFLPTSFLSGRRKSQTAVNLIRIGSEQLQPSLSSAALNSFEVQTISNFDDLLIS